MKKTNRITFIILSILILPLMLLANTKMPDRPDSWVNDYAGVLSSAEERNLTSMLEGLESRSSNQVFIAIFKEVPDGEYMDDYTNKLFEKWKPGLADKNNGLLLAIYMQDKKMRIEVGYGLEDVLTDAQSNTLITEVLRPSFKKGQYYGGIKAAMDMLIPALEGKYQIPVKKKSKSKKSPVNYIFVVMMILIVISRFFRGGGSSGMGTRRRSTLR